MQGLQLQSHVAFQGAQQSQLINCGTYKTQPLFVVRHQDRSDNFPGTLGGATNQYAYSIHTCRYAARALPCEQMTPSQLPLCMFHTRNSSKRLSVSEECSQGHRVAQPTTDSGRRVFCLQDIVKGTCACVAYIQDIDRMAAQDDMLPWQSNQSLQV